MNPTHASPRRSFSVTLAASVLPALLASIGCGGEPGAASNDATTSNHVDVQALADTAGRAGDDGAEQDTAPRNEEEVETDSEGLTDLAETGGASDAEPNIETTTDIGDGWQDAWQGDGADTQTLACLGTGKTPGGEQMDATPMLFCAPDNSACCATHYLAVPCGWEACCDDPVGPGTVIPGIPVNHPCGTLPKPTPGYAKSCLMDTIPFRTCTEQRKQILAGTLPFGPCSSGGNCCPLDPGCEPVMTKALVANPPPKTDYSKPADPTMQCDYYKHMFDAGSNASRHLVCKPGDKDCCWVHPPLGSFAPCGYDFCCQQDPSIPYGLTEASLTCAELDKQQQPVCLHNGTARYRHCNPSAETKAKADMCAGYDNIYVCCRGKSAGCENQSSVAFPKAPWE